MSTNFHISGTRSVTVNKTGVVETQQCDYDPWQTPTKVTNEILATGSPVEAYKAWVKSVSQDEQELVYGDDDIFCENEPVSSRTINVGTVECINVDEWVADAVASGYELEFYGL